MPTSSEPCNTEGRLEPVRSSPLSEEQRVFYPEGSESVWLVQSGRVDLFYQKMIDGEYGARHHIASFSKDQAIFGFDLQQYGGLALIAVMHPDAKLRRLTRAVFRRSNTLSDAMAPRFLVEEWVHSLTEAGTLGTPPHDAITIAAGAKLEAVGTTIAVSPEEMICWVRPKGGDFYLFGAVKTASECSALPLSRRGQAWLRIDDGASADVSAFQEVDRADPAWQWLDHFHALVLDCLLKKREIHEGEWRASLLQQQKSDALIAHRALKGLAAPLIPALKESSAASLHKDPLLAACKMLEQDLGIEFKATASSTGATSFRYAVEAIAHTSAVRQRRVTLRGDWWRHDCGPLLAMRKDDKRPMALLFRASGSSACFDPVDSAWQRLDSSIAASLSSAAFLFYRRFPLRALGGKELTSLIFGASRRDLLRVLIMGIVGGMLSLALPIATGVIFDSIIPGAERGQLVGMAGVLIVVSVAMASFTLVRSLSTLRVEARIDSVAQAAIWDRLLRLPATFFRRFSSGDLAIRSLAINQIRMILTNSTLSALLSGMFSLFNLVLLFVYSARLAWLALAVTAVFLSVTALAAYLQLGHIRNMARLRGRISATLLEFMNGISKLRVSGAEHRAFGVWAHSFSQQKRLYMKARYLAVQLSVVRSIYPVIAVAILFFVAAPQPGGHGKGALSTGIFLAALAAFVQFISCAVQFTSAFPSIISIVPVFERMLPILQTAPEVEEGRSTPGELRGGIEVSHLSFRYDSTSSPILRDVCFHIRPGEFVAFTGPSGSGKSTLLRLLLGFEIPGAGGISYDDQNIRGIDVQALRRQVGVVLQSGRLVSGTILDNIIGSLPLSHDDAWEAARMAGLDRDIKAMPMGLHTFVNDGGAGLSGGQRQRLMIARAIVNRPRILFFDEATSALDNATQAIVSRSLETLRATRIVIAHRLSTIQQADRIYVFDKGSIVQTGTYRELNREPGLFQTLVQRQIV